MIEAFGNLDHGVVFVPPPIGSLKLSA